MWKGERRLPSSLSSSLSTCSRQVSALVSREDFCLNGFHTRHCYAFIDFLAPRRASDVDLPSRFATTLAPLSLRHAVHIPAQIEVMPVQARRLIATSPILVVVLAVLAAFSRLLSAGNRSCSCGSPVTRCCPDHGSSIRFGSQHCIGLAQAGLRGVLRRSSLRPRRPPSPALRTRLHDPSETLRECVPRPSYCLVV